MFQWLAAREVVGGKAHLKMDVQSGLSEVSLVRDIVDANCQAKFKADRLKGISVVQQQPKTDDSIRASAQLFANVAEALEFRSQHHATMDLKERSKSMRLDNMAQVESMEPRHQIVYMQEQNAQGLEPQHVGSSRLLQPSNQAEEEEEDEEDEQFEEIDDPALDSQESEE